MKNLGQRHAWQRLLALLSVLAVFVSAPPPHEGGNPRPTSSLAPAPPPEMRAAVVTAPLTGHEPMELPTPLPRGPRFVVAAREGSPRERSGFAPAPRALSGVRQLGAG